MFYNKDRFLTSIRKKESQEDIMSVHKAISEHSRKQQNAIKRFLELDQKREVYIDEAIRRYKDNEPFTVDQINGVTKEINELATKEIIPTRKYVSIEMLKELVENK
jgi:hypothetical protein